MYVNTYVFYQLELNLKLGGVARVGQWFSVNSTIRGDVFYVSVAEVHEWSSGGVQEVSCQETWRKNATGRGKNSCKPWWRRLGVSGGGKKEERGLKLGWSGMWEGKPHRQDLACDPHMKLCACPEVSGRAMTWWSHKSPLSCSVEIVQCVGKSQGRCWAHWEDMHSSCTGRGSRWVMPRAVGWYLGSGVSKGYLAWLDSGYGVDVLCASLFQQYFVLVLYS